MLIVGGRGSDYPGAGRVPGGVVRIHYIYTHREGEDGYPATPRVSPWAIVRRPYRPGGVPDLIRAVGPFVGAYRIRPSPYPVAESFAPVGAFGGAYAIRPYEGCRVMANYQ